MKQWGLIFAAALASGAMLALSMPLAGWAGLGWVFLMPLLLATKGQGAFKGFLGGITAALFGGWVSTTPLVGSAVVEGGTAAWNYVGFGLYGMVMAVFVAWVAEIKRHSWKSLVPLACLGVGLECITFIRLPAHIALSQFANAPMLFLASVAGIWAVSWLLWLANLTVLMKPSRKRTLALGATACAAVAAQVLSMGHRMQVDPRPIASAEAGQVGLLQTDRVGADELLDLQAPLAKVKPVFAVWPELSVTSFDHKQISQFAASRGGWTVIASALDDHEPKPHNAAYAWGREGASRPYFKRKPFGEEASAITAGTQPVVVKVMPLDVGLNICFDSCYPWIMRETVLKGAEVIALPTLDPKSPNGFIQSAHAAFTTFRAAELGVPIVRAENTAWSMVVSGTGRMHSLAPVGWEGAVARPLPKDGGVTPYRLMGDWFLFGCLGVLGAAGVKAGGRNVARRARRRASRWLGSSPARFV